MFEIGKEYKCIKDVHGFVKGKCYMAITNDELISEDGESVQFHDRSYFILSEETPLEKVMREKKICEAKMLDALYEFVRATGFDVNDIIYKDERFRVEGMGIHIDRHIKISITL